MTQVMESSSTEFKEEMAAIAEMKVSRLAFALK